MDRANKLDPSNRNHCRAVRDPACAPAGCRRPRFCMCLAAQGTRLASDVPLYCRCVLRPGTAALPSSPPGWPFAYVRNTVRNQVSFVSPSPVSNSSVMKRCSLEPSGFITSRRPQRSSAARAARQDTVLDSSLSHIEEDSISPHFKGASL